MYNLKNIFLVECNVLSLGNLHTVFKLYIHPKVYCSTVEWKNLTELKVHFQPLSPMIHIVSEIFTEYINTIYQSSKLEVFSRNLQL